MSAFKQPKIGVYGDKDRLLQKTLSYERTSLTWHPITIYKYLGDATLGEGSSITDIQDNIFMENTDRRYDPNGIVINCHVEQQEDQPYDLSAFGIISPLGDTQIFRVHINSFEADGLSRYIIVGDVIEVPFFSDKNGNHMFFEVTDTDEKPTFENFYVTVTTTRVKDSQEMEEIEGIVSNSDALADLQADLNADYDATFIDEGLQSEPTLYSERGYVEDGYWDIAPTTTGYDDEAPRDEYSPRPNEDFLDDPNAKYF